MICLIFLWLNSPQNARLGLIFDALWHATEVVGAILSGGLSLPTALDYSGWHLIRSTARTKDPTSGGNDGGRRASLLKSWLGWWLSIA